MIAERWVRRLQWATDQIGRTERFADALDARLEKELAMGWAQVERVWAALDDVREVGWMGLNEREATRLMEVDAHLRKELAEAEAHVCRIERALRWNTRSMQLLADEELEARIQLARHEQELRG